jgi:hypothetical protein
LPVDLAPIDAARDPFILAPERHQPPAHDALADDPWPRPHYRLRALKRRRRHRLGRQALAFEALVIFFRQFDGVFLEKLGSLPVTPR